MRKKFRALDSQLGKQIKTEATRVHLNIQEIDQELSRILGLPDKPVQAYWSLKKKKRDLESKLKTKGF